MAPKWPAAAVSVSEYGQGEEYDLRLAEARLYDPDADERIVFWRSACFLERGFQYADALALALRRDVDRAEVEALLDAGATHDQARELVL